MKVVSSIKEAAFLIKEGSIIAFPTETSYGLGASIRRMDALDAVYALKQRDPYKPLLVLISSEKDLEDIINGPIDPKAKALMERFWPGPLTILFPARKDLPTQLKNSRGQIAVRLTSHPLAQKLIQCTGPITGTSANISGKPPALSLDDLRAQFGDHADIYVLDGGRLKGGPPSTIVDPMHSPPLILREGTVKREDILASHWKVP